MIQVEGLTKNYGSFKAIDSLSFHADAGEVVGFLGPNGAGKTTTMRILTGYMPPSSGRAIVAGFDVFEQSMDVRRNVGYLPETVPLYKELTVWSYVDYMASLHGMGGKSKANRVEEVLDTVGMLDRADSLIDSLSKGMRQRVGLAQALVHDPAVLILDEPTIGLDPRQVRDVRELIRSLGKDRTVLLSTHILSEVSQLCSRILIINNGQIVAEDSHNTLSARMQGTKHFVVRVRDVAPKELAKTLKPLKEVAEISLVEQGVEIMSKPDRDARPAVAEAIVKKSWELVELRSLDMSLEDIFLQLTDDQAAPIEEE